MLDALLDRSKYLFKSWPAWIVIISTIGLSVLGILTIGTVEPKYALTQMTFWLPVSMLFMVLCLLPNPRAIGLSSYLFFGGSLLLLAYLLVPGAPRAKTVNGAVSWLDLGVMNFQPSELTKVTFVLALAWHLSYRDSQRELKGLLIPFSLMLIPQILILKQPALGMALLFPVILFAILLVAGVKLRYLITFQAIGVALAGLVFINTLWMSKEYRILKPYQQVRIESLWWSWQGDNRMERDEGYQQGHGMTLISASGINGYRDQAGPLIRLNSLPEDHTDMVFCVLSARWGLLGIAGLFGLYLSLFGGMLAVAAKSTDPFIRLCCVGFAALFGAQMAANVGMCLGLLPITGLPLPFISYGGSSLLCNYGMIGFVLNFASRPNGRTVKPSFEFD